MVSSHPPDRGGQAAPAAASDPANLAPPGVLRDLRALGRNVRWAVDRARRRHRRLFLSQLTVTLVQSLIPAGIAVAIQHLVDSVTAAATHPERGTGTIFLWVAIAFAVSFAEVLAAASGRYLNQRWVDDTNLDVTDEVLAHAAALELQYFEDPAFQDTMSRLQAGIAQRFAAFVSRIFALANHALQMLSLIAILTVIEPLVLVALVVVALPYLGFQWRLVRSRYTEEIRRTRRIRWTNYFVGQLTGHESVPETKLLGLAPLFLRKFRVLMHELREENRAYQFRVLRVGSIFAGLTTLAFFATFMRVAFRATTGVVTLGQLAIYGGATARLRAALEQTIGALTEAFEHSLHIGALREFLALQPRPEPDNGADLVDARGLVEVRDVTFTYPGATAPTLRGVSFTVQPGETVALVGENGAGKTTLVKLIAKLYDPDAGDIRFDGVPLARLASRTLNRQIAFVFQQYGRYEASVGDNIAYGNWERLLEDRAELSRVVERAGVSELIADMPEGIDTLLGRAFGRYTPSGGQWQKIAIARAFARPAALLILDEPTSNLDPVTEYRTFAHFRDLAAGRTTILISHRFSTVSLADRIIVMEQGRVIESGTHADLLAQRGRYARMYELHRRKFLEGTPDWTDLDDPRESE